MITFLTSSPTGDLDGKYRVDGIDNRNGFLDTLRRYWREDSRCLIASACPEDRENNEGFAAFWAQACQASGLSCACVDILDAGWMDITKEQIDSYDLILLGGGHVPTQNTFFRQIGLRDKLQGYDGIVLGISAGSMNCAELVYAQPEEEGEAIDPDYQRFLPGLGLSGINVLPHYQMLKEDRLDGLRLFEDISCGDSEGKDFIAIPDGSYIMIEGDSVRICGEAWRIWPDCIERIQ